MSVDVKKYHQLICQACDPVLLLNVTNNTCHQLVGVTVEMSCRLESENVYVRMSLWREGRVCHLSMLLNLYLIKHSFSVVLYMR